MFLFNSLQGSSEILVNKLDVSIHDFILPEGGIPMEVLGIRREGNRVYLRLPRVFDESKSNRKAVGLRRAINENRIKLIIRRLTEFTKSTQFTERDRMLGGAPVKALFNGLYAEGVNSYAHTMGLHLRAIEHFRGKIEGNLSIPMEDDDG